MQVQDKTKEIELYINQIQDEPIPYDQIPDIVEYRLTDRRREGGVTFRLDEMVVIKENGRAVEKRIILIEGAQTIWADQLPQDFIATRAREVRNVTFPPRSRFSPERSIIIDKNTDPLLHEFMYYSNRNIMLLKKNGTSGRVKGDTFFMYKKEIVQKYVSEKNERKAKAISLIYTASLEELKAFHKKAGFGETIHAVHGEILKTPTDMKSDLLEYIEMNNRNEKAVYEVLEAFKQPEIVESKEKNNTFVEQHPLYADVKRAFDGGVIRLDGSVIYIRDEELCKKTRKEDVIVRVLDFYDKSDNENKESLVSKIKQIDS